MFIIKMIKWLINKWLNWLWSRINSLNCWMKWKESWKRASRASTDSISCPKRGNCRFRPWTSTIPSPRPNSTTCTRAGSRSSTGTRHLWPLFHLLIPLKCFDLLWLFWLTVWSVRRIWCSAANRWSSADTVKWAKAAVKPWKLWDPSSTSLKSILSALFKHGLSLSLSLLLALLFWCLFG